MFTITQCKKTRHYRIKCDAWLAAAVRQIPTRKWDKVSKEWLIPKVRLNIKALQDFINKHPCTISDELKNDILNYNPNKALKRIPFPKDYKFKVEPYNYQLKILDIMFGLDTNALFMDMGTGKTKVALEYMAAKKITYLIIMCPLSVVYTWKKEIELHLGDSYDVHISKEKTKRMDPDKNLIYLVGIESLSRKSKCYENVLGFSSIFQEHSIIVDEAHLIKTPGSTRTQNIIELGDRAKHKLILTGTPLTNNILDLYSLFNFLDPDIIGLGDFYSFKNRYCIYEERRLSHMKSYRELVGYQNMEELMDLLKDYIVRCKKDDVLDIPDKVYSSRYLEMTPLQRRTYDICKNEKVQKHTDKDKKDIKTSHKNILTKTVHLQNIAAGYVIKEDIYTPLNEPKDNPKIKELLKILESLPKDEQVIIWSKRIKELHAIYRMCKDLYTVVYYTGEVHPQPREVNLNLFQEKKVKLFLATPDCGSVGIDLTNCRYVVYFSNSFKLIDRLQSEDRCHRNGQTNKVTYIDLIYKNTIDEHILEAIKNKQDFSDYILDKLKDLTPKEILDNL